MIKFEMISKTNEWRPCLINNVDKAIFHRWGDKEETFIKENKSSTNLKTDKVISVDDVDTYVISNTVGIVEYEDGRIECVSPKCIRFLDSNKKFEEMCFETPLDKINSMMSFGFLDINEKDHSEEFNAVKQALNITYSKKYL